MTCMCTPSRASISAGRAHVIAQVLLLLALLAPFLGGDAQAFDGADVEPSVYKIYAFPADGKGYGFGSGFLVSGKRTVVTNYHVVENGSTFRVAYRDANKQGQLIVARVIATRPQLDIAILETDRDLPGKALALADYEPEKLANVITMGFPGAAEIRDRGQIRTKEEFEALLRDPTSLEATITKGAVSRMNLADMKRSETRTLHARAVQHNAQFSPGNSGGPLFDECNAVVGINTFLRTDAQGVFFSIHSSELVRTLREQSIPFTSINQCVPVAPTNYTIPIVIALSLTLAASALVLALRAGSLQQVGAQISRYTRVRRSEAPIAGGELRAAPAPGGSPAIALVPLAGGPAIAIAAGKALVVGRARTADLVIENDTVSSRHASLQIDPARNSLRITDLGSSNGTYLNNRQITTGEAMPGDTVRFGKAEFQFKADAPNPMAITPPRASTTAAKGWMLSGFDTSGRALQLEMRPASGETSRTWTIGRDAARAQLVIDDTSVSGAHAEISFTAGQGLTLRDLKSTNGTQVDGTAIGASAIVLSETGQEITFGAAKLRLSRLIT
jgi:pSer/pThr/pTyr-binding forkhead associated (FHA) protein